MSQYNAPSTVNMRILFHSECLSLYNYLVISSTSSKEMLNVLVIILMGYGHIETIDHRVASCL